MTDGMQVRFRVRGQCYDVSTCTSCGLLIKHKQRIISILLRTQMHGKRKRIRRGKEHKTEGQFMTDTVCIVVCTLELTIIR